MNDLKVGIIGLGRHFLAACTHSDLVGHLAVCDPDDDRRGAAQETHKVSAGCRGCVDAFLAALTGGTTHRFRYGFQIDAAIYCSGFSAVAQ